MSDAEQVVVGPGRRGRTQSSVPPFDPVDPDLPEPVERQVYRSLRRGMMRGLVPPDTVLTGRSLAQHWKLSVQPVRDALKRLEADGLIVGRPQSGFQLPGMTRAEYWEIIDIRTRLEGLAGRLAVPHMTPELIAQLRSLNLAMSQKTRSQEFLDNNFAFHFTVYSQANRPTLLGLIENFWVRIGPVLHLHPTSHTSQTTWEKHENIIAALERGDADGTEEAINADLVSAARIVVQNLT